MAERQSALTLDGIRADHVGRYRHAVAHVRVQGNILDAACGCGYGSWILAQSLCRVKGVDKDQAAVDFARCHWSHPRATYMQADVLHVAGRYDWVVSFETLEHVEQDGALLRRFAQVAPRLLLSVPNHERLPYNAQQFPFHVRHYTPVELEALLRGAGWKVDYWATQSSRIEAAVEPGSHGFTLVVTCSRLST